MTTLGYARVSTHMQHVDNQQQQLTDAGCERIFTDIASGATADRPQLRNLLEYARAGDVIVVTAADRLSRSLIDLVMLLEDLGTRDLEFRSLRERWDTTTPDGKLLLVIAAAFAQHERERISERTKAGLSAARSRGVRIGRPSVLSEDVLLAIAALSDKGLPNRQIAAALNISDSSVTRGLRLLKGRTPPEP